jgi:hypothetical protein
MSPQPPQPNVNATFRRAAPLLAAALLGIAAGCSQPPVSSNPDDVRRCQLQALEDTSPGVLPGSQLDLPIRRAELEKACLQEAAELRARGEVPR